MHTHRLFYITLALHHQLMPSVCMMLLLMPSGTDRMNALLCCCRLPALLPDVVPPLPCYSLICQMQSSPRHRDSLCIPAQEPRRRSSWTLMAVRSPTVTGTGEPIRPPPSGCMLWQAVAGVWCLWLHAVVAAWSADVPQACCVLLVTLKPVTHPFPA